MQKLSRQLGRSSSTPLHYPSSRGGGGGGGGGGGFTVGGGSSEKASAPESRKYGQPFCDKLFSDRLSSAPRCTGLRGPPEGARRRKTLDTLARAKEETRRHGGLSPRYSTVCEAVGK